MRHKCFHQYSSHFAVLIMAILSIGCKPKSEKSLKVSWELVSNFAKNGEAFEAKFVLSNTSDRRLNDQNWALFFSLSPRPLMAPLQDQAAKVEHLNGDWYRLSPNTGFRLDPDQSITITYWGQSGVIKETDAPLGLYFVFYDENGQEEVVRVEDFTVHPFERKEQLLRGNADAEMPSSPGKRYQENLLLTQLEEDQLQKIIPSPVSLRVNAGYLPLDKEWQIFYSPELANEARFLQNKLVELTGTKLVLKEGSGEGEQGVFLHSGTLEVEGKRREAYRLDIDEKGVTIFGSDASGVFYGVQSLLALLPSKVHTEDTPTIEWPYIHIEDAPRFHFRSLHMDVSRNFQTKETVLKTLDLLAHYKVNHFLFYLTEDEGWRLEIEGLPELTAIGGQRQHAQSMHDPVLHPSYGSGPVAYEKGKHGSGYYTKADFVEILQYASERHITVIPEVNFPGHARAAIKSMEARYNRLMEQGKEEEANEYRLIDPKDSSVYLSAQAYKDNVVNVARESTYKFYEKVVDEIGKLYEEAGLTMKIFHAGGDEVPEGSWTGSPMAKALLNPAEYSGSEKLLQSSPATRAIMNDESMMKDPKNLQAFFFRKLLEILEKKNLEIHVWEEMALVKTPDGKYQPNPEFVGKNVVPYIWNNMFDYPDLGYQLANIGYEVVLCNVSNFYFDLAYDNDPQEPGLYWAGFVDTRDAWTFAPFDFFKTTFASSMGRKIDQESEFKDMVKIKPEARKNIKGLEAQLWGETIKGADMLEHYMLPKLLGFAESAWAKARQWETIEDAQEREKSIQTGWNVFANTLAQRELPKMAFLNGGYGYRIPSPGAIIENGTLKANVALPGLDIRYTLDGADPDKNSFLYVEPIPAPNQVKIKSFDKSGRSSALVTLGKE